MKLGHVPIVCEHCTRATPATGWHYCDYCAGHFCDGCLKWYREGAGTVICPTCVEMYEAERAAPREVER